jgi:60 kDa SS-A/Ro ribonucleoprotein
VKNQLLAWATDHPFESRTIVAGEKGPRKQWNSVEGAKERFLKEAPSDRALRVMWAFERAKIASSEQEAVQLIKEFGLPMEAIPTNLRGQKVYEAIYPEAGLTWLIRNLGNLSKHQILTRGGWDTINAITKRLVDEEELRKARIHPIHLLTAMLTYAAGHGARGGNTWEVVPQITGALEQGFYKAFKLVEPTGKRLLIGVDVSGSMDGGSVAGVPGLTPRIAAGAIAMIFAKTEQNVELMAFSTEAIPLDISRDTTLSAVCQTMRQIRMGGTDCALPMMYAMGKQSNSTSMWGRATEYVQTSRKPIDVDAFITLTDNETWAGSVHPKQALDLYRQERGIAAKSVVMAFTATNFSIADPARNDMLDVVGLDSAAPQVVSDFIADRW